MAAPASPYSFRMNRHMTQTVSGFLGWRDSLTIYAHLSRSHRDDVYTGGLPTEITIPTSLAKQLFENIGKFTKLHSIRMDCTRSSFEPFNIQQGTGKVDRLCFQGAFSTRLPTPCILMFLEAIRNLKGFSLNGTEGYGRNAPLFQPIEGERISAAAIQNLGVLTDLELSDANIDVRGIVEILQSSKNFRSVNINGQPISNEIFHELVQQPNLCHLNLLYTSGEDLDYRILAGCHSLVSFTPYSGYQSTPITEDALVSIIEANLTLEKLYLSNCKSEIVTDRVLQAIGTKLPGLVVLSLPSGAKVTDEGLGTIIRGCQHLGKLSLNSSGNISSMALEELRNCTKLKKLSLKGFDLNDQVLTTIATMHGLTTLNLGNSQGVTVMGLTQLHALVNLEKLNLDGVMSISDEVIAGFVAHCPRLETLRMNAWGAAITVASLDSIRTAVIEGQSALRHVSCRESGLDHELIDQFAQEMALLKIS